MSDSRIAIGEPRRFAPAWLPAARLIGGAAVVYLAYAAFVDRSRVLEAGVVGDLLETATGGRVNADFASHGILYVDPHGSGDHFAARITRSCSVLTPIALVAWVAICASRGRLARRLIGLGVAVSVLVVVDLLRVSLVILTGSRFGGDTMVVTHDWLGTLLTLVSVVVGILVLWAVSGGRPSAGLRPKRQA